MTSTRRPPRYAVWEITLACNAHCLHCGSSAGAARPDELDGTEALALCDALADLGVTHATLSGGDPLVRPDWPVLAERMAGRGLRVEMITNGLALDAAAARRAREAGLRAVTLSIDGPEPVHDELRGVPGAFRRALEAAEHLRAAGYRLGAVTQVNTRNRERLDELEEVLAAAGFEGWQIQLTMAHGRCTEHADLPLRPEQVPAVVRFLLTARARGRVPAYAADNLGWMQRCEPQIRSLGDPADRFFPGCGAGLEVLGLASDGTVRGCLSLPPAFDEGNVRRRPLADIWADPAAFSYNRGFAPETLTGHCAACPFARVCRGGCRSIAFAATGGVSENPYCARRFGEDGA